MKKMKKYICAALAAAVAITAIPTYSTSAATISELQQKRKNLASSTEKAKQEIQSIKNKQLSADVVPDKNKARHYNFAYPPRPGLA